MVATLCFGKLKDIFRRVRLIVEGIEKILIRTVEDAGPYGINLIGQLESNSFYSIKVDIIGAKRYNHITLALPSLKEKGDRFSGGRVITPHSTLHSPHLAKLQTNSVKYIKIKNRILNQEV